VKSSLSFGGIAAYLVMGAGIFMIYYAVAFYFWDKYQINKRFQKRSKIENIFQKEISNAVSISVIKRYKLQIEAAAEFVGFNWSFTQFISYTLACALIGIFVSIMYLNNVLVAVPLSLTAALIPWGTLMFFAGRKRNMIDNLLDPVIQLFISEYNSYNNIIVALNNIVPKIEGPLREEFSRLSRELNSGRNYIETLTDFALRLDNHWVYKFSHILSIRLTKGLEISEMLLSLLMEIKTRKVQIKQRKAEIIGVKAEHYLLYLATPLMYIFASRVNPKAHYLLTQTSQGKKLMFFIVVSLLISIAGTFWFSNQKIKS